MDQMRLRAEQQTVGGGVVVSRVTIANQVSIWCGQDEPTGVKWKRRWGFFSSHALTSGVVWLELAGADSGSGLR